MAGNLRRNTLLSNIAQNFVNAGQHRPLQSPTNAVLTNQTVNLRNNIFKSQEERAKAAAQAQQQQIGAAAERSRAVNQVLTHPQLKGNLQKQYEVLGGLPGPEAEAAQKRIGEALKERRAQAKFGQKQKDAKFKGMSQDAVDFYKQNPNVPIGPEGYAAINAEKAEGPESYAPSTTMKMILERRKLIDEGADPNGREVMALDSMLDGTKNRSSAYRLNPEETEALDRAVNNGLDPYKVNSRTGKLYAKLEMETPGRAWNTLGAEARFEKALGVMNTKALLKSIDPLLDNLLVAGKNMTDTGSPLLNKPLHAAQKWLLPDSMGGVEVTGFDNLRDDTIAEVERGLLGTGVLSDSKYMRAIGNLNSAQTDKQRAEAIKNIKIVISTRLAALQEGPSLQEGQTEDAVVAPRLKTLTNPNTGLEETWNLDTETQVK